MVEKRKFEEINSITPNSKRQYLEPITTVLGQCEYCKKSVIAKYNPTHSEREEAELFMLQHRCKKCEFWDFPMPPIPEN